MTVTLQRQRYRANCTSTRYIGAAAEKAKATRFVQKPAPEIGAIILSRRQIPAPVCRADARLLTSLLNDVRIRASERKTGAGIWHRIHGAD